MKSWAAFLILAAAMLTYPRVAEWFVLSCLALGCALALTIFVMWLWAFMNFDGNSHLPEDLQ